MVQPVERLLRELGETKFSSLAPVCKARRGACVGIPTAEG